MLLITEIPQQETRIFNSISFKNEIQAETKKTEILDYMITVYPRNELKSTFNFVYSLFEVNELSFSVNQDSLLYVANKMFEGSKNLSDFEQNVLSQTFRKSVKYSPTLPGRK
jgi:hypothetical protein